MAVVYTERVSLDQPVDAGSIPILSYGSLALKSNPAEHLVNFL